VRGVAGLDAAWPSLFPGPAPGQPLCRLARFSAQTTPHGLPGFSPVGLAGDFGGRTGSRNVRSNDSELHKKGQQLPTWRSLRGRLTLLPTDDSVSLSSFGGEGWGEEAVPPGGSHLSCMPPRLCPSPSAPLARRGRNARWQCQDALFSASQAPAARPGGCFNLRFGSFCVPLGEA